VKYSLEQRDFLYDNCVKNEYYKSCKGRFRHKYPGVRYPALLTMFKSVKSVCSARPFLDMKYTRQNAVLYRANRGKLDDTGARLAHSPLD
jgi:hypothetical protein